MRLHALRAARCALPALLALLLALPARAQGEGLTLRLSRDFGYGGFGEIEGLFTMKAEGPPALVSVQFLIDGAVVHQDSQAPFRFQFRTGSYSLGPHTLSAAGQTADGQQLTSNEIHTRFVSPEVGNQTALRIMVPLLAVAILAVLLAAGGPWLLEKITGKKRARRGYGLMGGAICPRCGRPFGRHWWAPNVLLGKLDRCPHCGKWSVVRAAPPDVLRAAEETQGVVVPGVEALTPEERLRRQIEDSRFDAG